MRMPLIMFRSNFSETNSASNLRYPQLERKMTFVHQEWHHMFRQSHLEDSIQNLHKNLASRNLLPFFPGKQKMNIKHAGICIIQDQNTFEISYLSIKDTWIHGHWPWGKLRGFLKPIICEIWASARKVEVLTQFCKIFKKFMEISWFLLSRTVNYIDANLNSWFSR